MSSRALRRLRGNRVFEIAEQLGLHKSSEEEDEEEDQEEEYESEQSSQYDTQPPHITDIVDSTQQPQTDDNNQQQITLTDEEKKKKKRNKNKKKNKKKKQKKKAEELAKKKAANKKQQNKNKQPSNKPKKYNKNKNKNKNKKSPPKSQQNSSTKKQDKQDNQEKKQNDTLQIDEICSKWNLLTCDTRYFDPNFELKRKFGSIALEANDEYTNNDANNIRNKSRNSKQNRMIKAKQKQLNNKFGHLQKRKITLIKFNSMKWPTPYLHFSKKTGNIYMDLLAEDNKTNMKYFQFKYDNDYNRTQLEYKQCCSRFDPQQISFLLQQHPYHVDTCLTMSDILSKHGKLEDAADIVERALYRLECGLHSRFSFISSDCRLDYSLIENRSFFLCLWKYSQNLGRRGCVHSAFELTKSLLSLSPIQDPLCSLLCLDYWALRAIEYEWMLEFASSFKINIFSNSNHNLEEMDALRMYPNWCYSVAFAKYQIEHKESYQNKHNKAMNTYSQQYRFGDCDNRRIPMDLTVVNGLSASILIQQAILMFPEVIGPLLSKANERVLGQSQWKSIMQNEYYLKAKLRRNEIGSIDKLCRIYSERAHALWNNDDLFKWLWKHCRFILQRLNNPRSFKIVEDGMDETKQGDDDGDNDDEDAELVEFEDLSVFNGIRDSVYDNKSGKRKGNKFHMLDINEFSDVITTLPVEDLPDALMRPQTININDLQNLNGDELNHVVDQLLAAGIELPPEIQQRLNQGQHLQNQNVLSAMLYSMMPWVNPIIHNNNNNEQKDNENDNKNDEDDNQ